ncbi:MAG TPA: LuxR C-terminal-related transcriptional regulator [Dongiaceae bacterium]|nr:LuxR C-terminal-related transcriptional regulator [Dongiaceae bacterium]
MPAAPSLSAPSLATPDAALAPQPDWLPRPQLLALLDKAGAFKLTSLQAPAGSGKTTLLSQWHRQHQSHRPMAWLKLEPAHNDPVRFFSDLIAAIRAVQPGFDAYYLNQLADDVEFSVDAISESLRQGFAALTEELFVLLDDYQFIAAPAIHRTLADVLLHLPHPVHFVIASRTHPPLQLSRLKLEDELLLLDIHDLRWEPGEIEALARRLQGADLDSHDVSQLAQMTEGWIAGIKLILLSARRGRQPLQQHVNGNHPEVIQYLADAVLEQQPQAVRDFLLQTSMLETLEADLCNRLLDIPNASQLLEQLMANQLFIQAVDGPRPGYRYHSLFREFLQHRLRVEHPEKIITLHRSAAQWYEAQQDYVQALELLRACDDRDGMQALLQRCAEDWIRQGELDVLVEWANQLPEEAMVAQSDIAFPFVAGLLFSRRFNQATYFLAELERHLQQGTLQGRYADADSMQFLHCVLELFQRDTDFVHNPLYQAEATLAHHHDLRLFYRAMRAYHHLLNGRFGAAAVEAQRAKDFLRQNGHDYLSSFADLILVLTERAQGHMAASVFRAETAFRERGHAPMTPGWVNSATSIAVIRYEQNRMDEAEKMLRELLPKVSSACATEVISVNYCLLARIRFQQGHEREALRLLDYLSRVLQHGNYERFSSQIALERVLHGVAVSDHDLLAKVERDFALKDKLAAGYWHAQTLYDDCRERLGIAFVLILQSRGELDAAEEILRQLCQVTLQQGCAFRWALCRTHLALLHWRRQDEAGALQLLADTMRQTHLACFSRTLFDEAPGSALLMRRAIESGVIRPLPSLYIDMFGPLLDAAGVEVPPQQALAPVEALTDKEGEILRLLQAGASNKEVSRRAGISLATTKWHLKNIYAKLAVGSRTDAVSKARQLRLL